MPHRPANKASVKQNCAKMGIYARPDWQVLTAMKGILWLTIELRSEGSSFVALEASRSSSLRRLRLVLTCNELQA